MLNKQIWQQTRYALKIKQWHHLIISKLVYARLTSKLTYYQGNLVKNMFLFQHVKDYKIDLTVTWEECACYRIVRGNQAIIIDRWTYWIGFPNLQLSWVYMVYIRFLYMICEDMWQLTMSKNRNNVIGFCVNLPFNSSCVDSPSQRNTFNNL